MTINVARGSSIEFVAELFGPRGVSVTPPVGIWLTLAYTGTGGSTQSVQVFLRSMETFYIGYLTTPSNMAGTGVLTLSLTSSGAFPVRPPDPYLRIVG